MLFESSLSPAFKAPTWGFLVFFSLFIFHITKRFYVAFFSPVARVPGPVAAKFTRLWELVAFHRGDFEKTTISLHERYGPVVRIAPNRFSINDPEAIKVILGHGPYKKSRFYSTFASPGGTNTFSEQNFTTHSMMRRRVSVLYSTSALLSYEGFIDSCTATLVEKLRKFADTKQQVPIPVLLQYYAFDVIGEITVGHSFGLLQDEGDSKGIIKTIDEAHDAASQIALIPESYPIIAQIGKLPWLEPPFKAINKFVQEHIDARAQGKEESNRADFLTKLLNLEESGKNTRFDTWNSALTNIAAGSDTTATALSSVVYHLLKVPRAMERLRREIDEARDSGQISNPITFKEAQKLTYLQAVIMEALRIHPGVGQPLVRLVPENGAVISGYHFPPGAEVGINPWAIHFNKDAFGEDANVFRPERWLCDGPERSRLEQNFLAFGAGTRACLGKNISLLEISKVIPQLIQTFDFRLESSEKEWKTINRWFVKTSFNSYVSIRS